MAWHLAIKWHRHIRVCEGNCVISNYWSIPSHLDWRVIHVKLAFPSFPVYFSDRSIQMSLLIGQFRVLASKRRKLSTFGPAATHLFLVFLALFPLPEERRTVLPFESGYRWYFHLLYASHFGQDHDHKYTLIPHWGGRCRRVSRTAVREGPAGWWRHISRQNTIPYCRRFLRFGGGGMILSATRFSRTCHLVMGLSRIIGNLFLYPKACGTLDGSWLLITRAGGQTAFLCEYKPKIVGRLPLSGLTGGEEKEPNQLLRQPI